MGGCFVAACLLFGCNTASRRGNTGADGTGNTAESRAQSSAATPRSAPPQVTTVQQEPLHPQPGVGATPETLLDFERIACEWTPQASFDVPLFHSPSEGRFYDSPEDNESPNPGYTFVALTADNSKKWGRVLRARDAAKGKFLEELRHRDYLLGTGAVDECGTVTYNGSLWSAFSATSKRLLSLQAVPLNATLIDHRKRSSSCSTPEAPLMFIEDSPGSQAVYRFGRHHGKPLFPRTVYGTGALSGEGERPLANESPLAKSSVCPFGPRPGQSYKDPLRTCEVGTYFAEDDLPKLGKLVVLTDFGGKCKSNKKGHWIAGPRFYILGASYKDACGSVTYQPYAHNDTPVLPNEIGSVRHRLEMLDHRMRNQSQACPPPPAAVELHETVVASTRAVEVFRRSFYAPTELQVKKK